MTCPKHKRWDNFGHKIINLSILKHLKLEGTIVFGSFLPYSLFKTNEINPSPASNKRKGLAGIPVAFYQNLKSLHG